MDGIALLVLELIGGVVEITTDIAISTPPSGYYGLSTAPIGGFPYDFSQLGKADAMEANYEKKDVYKELKAMKKNHSISEDEYNQLIAHQKVLEERNELLEELKSFNYSNYRVANKELFKIKTKIDSFYERGYISPETNEKIKTNIQKIEQELKIIEATR
ncbi:MAG: hypothetical protein K6B64_04260 [Acholeplasmatales bacterium]|nr:hypothetical protein [Acholeplasmatales bacterium]